MMNSTETFGKLRSIHDDELELMLSWRNALPVRQNMYTTDVISLEKHLKWYESARNNSKMRYFMYQDQQQLPWGIVAFTDIDPINRQSSWAFYADPSAPKGTGSKMEFLALDYAFHELNLHKLSCEVLDYNMPVVKLHRKFGFQDEGYLREHHLYNQQFCGIHRLAILQSEWQKKRESMLTNLLKFQHS